MTTGADWVDSARKLIEVVRGGLADATSAAATAPSGQDQPAGTHGSDCRWCPLCQAAAVVRGERPEVSAALADVLAATATALRAFAAGPEAPDEPGRAGGDGTGPGDPPPTAQRIEIA
jgi:hypothetical protein